MAPFNLSQPDRPIRVGVILANSETELQDVAPVDMIHGLDRKFVNSFPDQMGPPNFKDGALDLEFHWVSEHGEKTQATLSSGLRPHITDSFETCPALDIVIIGAYDQRYTPSEGECAFLRKAYEECQAFLTVCAGVDWARRAGLLDGKTATAPRPFVALFNANQEFGTTKWVEKRWVRDGKLWTSGALFNGCDMTHNFIKHTWGNTPAAVIVKFLAELGSWPDRDVDYKDGF